MTTENFRSGILLKQYRISVVKELFRKSIHLCSALVPTLLAISYVPVMVLLVLALVLYSVCEILRLKGITVPLVSKITAVAARKRDENKFVLGPVTLVIGILLAALFFKGEPARIGIYALAFGDGLASLTGKLIGRVYIPFTHGKTVAGSLACFYAVFLSSFLVCKNPLIALILASVATFVEVIPMTDFDNVVIPVLIAFLAKILL